MAERAKGHVYIAFGWRYTLSRNSRVSILQWEFREDSEGAFGHKMHWLLADLTPWGSWYILLGWVQTEVLLLRV